MEIKSIDTEYNGYKCRSRLEARWLYFFDLMDVKYEYEPQGVTDGHGFAYLPDIYLPDFNCYVEIKNESIASDEKKRTEAEGKLQELMKWAHNEENNGYWCMGLLICGDPYNYYAEVYHNFYCDSGGGCDWIDVRFRMSPFAKGLEIVADEFAIFENMPHGYGAQCDIRDWFIHGGQLLDCRFSVEDEAHKIEFCDYFQESTKKARQVRFEHGEHPLLERDETGSCVYASYYMECYWFAQAIIAGYLFQEWEIQFEKDMGFATKRKLYDSQKWLYQNAIQAMHIINRKFEQYGWRSRGESCEEVAQ